MTKEERRRRVLCYIANDMSITDMADTLEVCRHTIHRDLKWLITSKLLRARGYELTQKAKALLDT